jgi:hypothetical protein
MHMPLFRESAEGEELPPGRDLKGDFCAFANEVGICHSVIPATFATF